MITAPRLSDPISRLQNVGIKRVRKLHHVRMPLWPGVRGEGGLCSPASSSLPPPFQCPRSGFHVFQCCIPPAPRHSPHSSEPFPLSKLFSPFVQFVGNILFPRVITAAPRSPPVWRAETASSAKPIYRAPRARFPVQINPPSTILSFHHSFLPSSPLVPRPPNLTTAARQSPKNKLRFVRCLRQRFG